MPAKSKKAAMPKEQSEQAQTSEPAKKTVGGRAKIDFKRDYCTVHGQTKSVYYQDGKEFDANGIELTESDLEVDLGQASDGDIVDENTLADMHSR